MPVPGSHLPGAAARQEPADPNRIRAEVAGLLAELGPPTAGSSPAENTETGADITRRARILEQAHDVLVDALATVDKI
ncbi:hypothetical protein BOX37_10275 [Nocardia mangyaensis]|uniref:Uncharacterized protein n=2 Tax=Nocardiaceae TaxID=85025 RepID=A0A1J0VQH0_9NOCA|nr:hypothetical protein BOX37_10275 [Nocardia mangyaensis]